MHFVAILTDRDDGLPIRLANRPAHHRMAEGRPAWPIAGPFLDDKGDMVGSLLIIEAEDEAAARAVFATDPYAKAGLFKSTRVDALALGRRQAGLIGRISSTERPMAHWLFKSEPDVFSFDDLTKKGAAGQEWDGVRNYQARNNMRAMQVGDRGFFYHSNKGKEIVGIVEVAKLAHPDSTDDSGRWECVDIRAVRAGAEALFAGRGQGRAAAERHGAGRQFPPFGAAGDRRGMGADLRTGRARPDS